ncbi:hypothetical protein CYMTET_38501 [Cymbomonas tetramitiformis]|uniref:RanBD1 domain-containing protein n=1 Tax=Cymbomonas tetramitiformis TaxID=36881 RepID=A0AAE0CDG7_9CHLO|nr:hypothetical protein CYMTET_38501 [Cymbomonas tetramitiformis]|eukprot:gene22893-27674_t
MADEATDPKPETAEEAPAPAEAADATETPAAPPAFGFGAVGGESGFQFGGIGAAPPAPVPIGGGAAAESADDAADAERDCAASFAPIVNLEAVDVVTGEEGEDILYEQKAKAYRFDTNGKSGPEWKERGLGQVKILEDKETKKKRLLMRREKTHKICLNQAVSTAVTLAVHPGSDKSWVWTAMDFSDGELKEEVLCIKFGTVEKAEGFKAAYEDAQSKVSAEADASGEEKTKDEKEEAAAPTEEEKEEVEEKADPAADDLAEKIEKVAVEES